MRKIIMTECSAAQLKLKDGDVIKASGVKRMVVTFDNFDPFKDLLLTDEEVKKIIKHNTIELAINPNNLTNP